MYTAVCTPTRYGVLTGRYCWRTRLKTGVFRPWDPPLIDQDRLTVGSFLKQHGYHTACIGKWHLGWDWCCKRSDYSWIRLLFWHRRSQFPAVLFYRE
ncbi:MAG: sulfatase-like hydrolase/transferase [Planctomycetota bacterium]